VDKKKKKNKKKKTSCYPRRNGKAEGIGNAMTCSGISKGRKSSGRKWHHTKRIF
jgi:hypothetical protein